jgi:hypothetical protein
MQRTGASVKDAQGAMRHASPDQTLRVYMREIPDGSRMAIDALELLYDAKCGLAAGTPRGAAN